MNGLKHLALSAFMISSAIQIQARPLSVPTDVSQENKPKTLKVLLLQNSDSFLLDATGAYKVYNPITGCLVSEEKRSRLSSAQIGKTGIVWEENYPGMFQLRIVPSNGTSLLVNGIQYKGCLEICEVGGKLAVINEVDVESYLKSVLAQQAIATTNPEVLNSLAIAARTNLYYLASQKDCSWHIEAKEHPYTGHALTAQNLALEQALRDTRHVAMTYENAPFPTTWSADSGGRSASYTSVFRKNGKVPQGIFFAASEKERQKRKWTLTLTKHDLAQILQVPEVSGMNLFVDKEAGKVYGVKVMTGTSFTSMDFFSFQKQLGENNLKSNDFQVKSDKDRLIFEGVGEGCGVGLCLYSADILAKHGKTAPEILKTFYPGVKIQNFSPL